MIILPAADRKAEWLQDIIRSMFGGPGVHPDMAMANMFEKAPKTKMVIMNSGPKVQVFHDANGNTMVVKKVKRVIADIGSGMPEEMERGMGLGLGSPEGLGLGLGMRNGRGNLPELRRFSSYATDPIPEMRNPLEAIANLLYAFAQKEKYSRDVFDEDILPAAQSHVGSDVVEELKSLFENPPVKEIAGDTSMAENANRCMVLPLSALLDLHKYANGTFWSKRNTETEIAKLVKEGKVQTSIPKLMDTLEYFEHKTASLNSVLIGMLKKGYLTLADKTAQNILLGKLSEILKGIPEETDEAVHDYIYNTKISNDEPEIKIVKGVPIDIKKLESLSKEEASSALGKDVSVFLFDDSAGHMTLEKLEDLIKFLDKPDKVIQEEIDDRILGPVLNFFKAEDSDDPKDIDKEKVDQVKESLLNLIMPEEVTLLDIGVDV